MTTVLGTWAVTMRTPIGKIGAHVTIDEADGVLSGTAASRHETVPLEDIQVHVVPGGQQVTWRQTIARPMRLNLEFVVVVIGDVLEGTSRAGRLPTSTVTGHRVSPAGNGERHHQAGPGDTHRDPGSVGA